MDKKEQKLNESKTEKAIYKKWWFIIGIAVIIIAIIFGIIFLTKENKTQITSNETSVVDRNTEVSNIKEAKTLEKLESIIATDIESTINGLSNEWEELKKEINTYDEYLNKIEKVENYYEKIEITTEQLSVRLYSYSANCAELILSSNKDYKDKYDELDMINDVIYDDACGEIEDEIYDGILKNMEDVFYDGIIKGAKDTVPYSDWYDTSSEEYEMWYDTSSEVYEIYYDTGSDIYELYYDLSSDVYSNKMEDANKTLKDFQEDVNKIAHKGGKTNTQKIEKVQTNNSLTENKTEKTQPTENTSSNSNELSKEFKEAMDSYEEFMNEYVEFMKKYNANPTDSTLLSQYATMLQKYSEQISAFNKWESKDMTTEEAAYYVDVQARVTKKLLEVAQ